MATEQIAEDELKPEETQGFRVGEKKTIDEYNQLGTWSPNSFNASLVETDGCHCALIIQP